MVVVLYLLCVHQSQSVLLTSNFLQCELVHCPAANTSDSNSVQEIGIVQYSVSPWLDTKTSECSHLTGHKNKCQTIHGNELYALYLGGSLC
jgi:hypothetical protein